MTALQGLLIGFGLGVILTAFGVWQMLRRHLRRARLAERRARAAERMGVRIRAEPKTGALTASIDGKLVKQALLNLMLNATQAMAAAKEASGGTGGNELILRTEQGRDHDGRGVARVHVIDTGPG